MADLQPNIYSRLRAVQAALKAPKGQRNSFGNYNYRSAEDILEAVKPLLVEHQLTLVVSDELVNFPSTHAPEKVELKDNKGNTSTVFVGGDRFYVKARAQVICSNSDLDHIEAYGFAREDDYKKGMDGSQVTGAASSYARKYALNGLFAIDDTKDADSDAHTSLTRSSAKPSQPAAKPAPKPQTAAGAWPASDKQKQLIATKLNGIGIAHEEQAGYLIEQYGVELPLTKEGASFVIEQLLGENA